MLVVCLQSEFISRNLKHDFMITINIITVNIGPIKTYVVSTGAVLSQGGPRDAAVHFDTYRILQRYRAVSRPQHAFLVGFCLQTAVNYLSKSEVLERTSQMT